MTQTLTATRISLGLGHENGCNDFAGPLLLQLGSGKYDLCSVMDIPASVDEWRAEHRTARKRADRAARLGYRFDTINRADYSEDIHAINLSLPERQGRPMTDAYRTFTQFGTLPEYPCEEHGVRTYGVLKDDTLVAYLWLYRSGELALVSSILGHGEVLPDGIMFLLVQGAIEREMPYGGYLVYNRADSGTDNLRWFKTRLGFSPTTVDWCP